MTKRAPLQFNVEVETPAPVKAIGKAQAVETKQVGARISADLYRRFKARAAMKGVTVAVLVEQAVTHELERD